jgi:hypothetical protein
LSYNGNLLVENGNELIVKAEVFAANGTAERDAALVMLKQIPGKQAVTVGVFSCAPAVSARTICTSPL